MWMSAKGNHHSESRMPGGSSISSCLRTLLALAALLACAFVLRAQNPNTMMPEQSAAKAKELIQQMIDAMGGTSYLNASDRDAMGRLSAFGNNGEVVGYTVVRDVWKYPDKHRSDYSGKGNIVDLFAGDKGWTLDHSGVHDQPDDAIKAFRESLQKNLDYILRVRLQENTLVFRYAGTGLVDMKQSEWVELDDRDQKTFRIAIDHFTHLPLRMVYEFRDPETRDRMEEATLYSNWHMVGDVNVPYQVMRERNGRHIYQLFLSECKINAGIGDDFFSREALEERWKKVGKK
jgi:hypothetical protein